MPARYEIPAGCVAEHVRHHLFDCENAAEERETARELARRRKKGRKWAERRAARQLAVFDRTYAEVTVQTLPDWYPPARGCG